MASEWRTFRVSDFAEVIGGGTPKTNISDFWNGSIPWITPKDLSNHSGKYIYKGERNISAKGLRNSSARILPQQTVLLTSRAPVGYLAIAKNELATNQGFRSLVVKEGFCPDFVYYLLLQNKEYLKRHASGSTFQELSGSTLKNLEFVLPVKTSEQRAIAHILGTLDDKIELNRKMNETLEAMARAIFKAWFVDFEPVRAKMEGRWQHGQSLPGLPAHLYDLFPNRLVDSELGEIPEGWNICPFTETVEIIGGGTPKTSIADYWDGGIPWFSVVDAPLLSDVWVMNTEKEITEEGLKNSSTKVLPIGSTIISARGTVGRIALVGKPMAMNQSCYALRGKTGSQGTFNYYTTRALIEILQQHVHGSVFDTITRDTLAGVKVVVPPENLVEVFEASVDPLLQQIRTTLLESRTLSPLRDTLLPKLISGNLRVNPIQNN